MTPLAMRRKAATLVVGLVGFLAASAPPASPAGPRSIDPALVLPLDKIPPQHRESVVEIIRDHTIHRKGRRRYLPLPLEGLPEPAERAGDHPGALAGPRRLRPSGSGSSTPTAIRGPTAAGTTATWEYVHRSPKLHVLLSDLDYVSPRGGCPPRTGRIS